MDFGILWMLMREAFLAPSPWTWALLALPVLAAVIFALSFRASPLGPDKAWRKVGERWRVIGLVIAGAAILLYLVNAWQSDKTTAFGIIKKADYDNGFRERLAAAALSYRMAIPEPKAKIRELAMMCDDTEQLADLIKDFTDRLPEDKRITFIQACQSTKYKEDFSVFFDPLYWPPERIEEYKKKNNGASPIIAGMADLQYSSAQIVLHEKKDYKGLYKSLTLPQWKLLRNQFVAAAKNDREVLTSMLSEMCDCFGQGSPEVQDMLDKLYEKAFGEDKSRWIANSLGADANAPVIRFFWNNIRWLRDLPWLLIYLAAGIVILVQAGRTIRQGGRPNMFT